MGMGKSCVARCEVEHASHGSLASSIVFTTWFHTRKSLLLFSNEWIEISPKSLLVEIKIALYSIYRNYELFT